MKRILTFVLLICLVALLASCGCEHEWTAATCQAPSTCNLCGKTDGDPLAHTLTQKVILEPVEGKAGSIGQVCTVCDTAAESEEYTLSTIHDGTTYTLNVEEYCSRLNNILGTIRPELSCRIESSKSGNPTIYVFWQEEGYLTAISPNNANEEALTSADQYPSMIRNLMQLNTTQATTGENPIPVFDLQMDTLQAMIMACDPQISGADARQIVTDFLESGETYVFENHGDLEYYFFLSNLGQPLLNLSISPIA